MSNRTNATTYRSLDRRQFIRAAGAGAVVGLAGCAGGDGGATPTGTPTGTPGGKSIVFGQPALLTGGIAFIQPPVSASADLAQQMINDAGGPLDRKLELIRRDTGYKPPKARQVLRQFVNVDNAVVINGLTSTTTVPNWDFIQQLQVPIVTMYAGTRFLDTRGGDKKTPSDLSDDEWHWRTTGADSQHTAGAALHAKDAGVQRIAVINTKTAGARTWAKAFFDAVKAIDDLEAVNRMEVEGGKTSYRSDLETFFQDDFDLWGVAIEEAPDAITLLQQWRQGGYGGKVMLSNPMKTPKLRKEVGEALEDEWVRVSVPAIAGPWSDQYLEGFRNFVEQSGNYKDDLSVNNWSASAYDSITISALAIEAAGEASHDAVERNLGPVARPPGTKVSTFAEGKKALANGEEINYQGAQTQVNFDRFGNVFNAAQIFSLAPDEWKEVTQIETSRIRNVVKEVAQQGS